MCFVWDVLCDNDGDGYDDDDENDDDDETMMMMKVRAFHMYFLCHLILQWCVPPNRFCSGKTFTRTHKQNTQ